jgi:hypothetical protein
VYDGAGRSEGQVATVTEEIKSPVCPMCGVAPQMAMSIAQAFCETSGCPVLCWDMRVTPEQFRRDAVAMEWTPPAGAS